MIREFDAREGVARALGALPRLAEALARGELSYAKVRALTRVATPETEERLLKFGRVATAAHMPEQRGQSALDEGGRVSAETSQRLACDASRVVMRHDADGRIVEVGARTRTIPPMLRRALQHRDGGCRFPGCGVRFGQGHHIRHWAQGGPTKLSNLTLLCRRHHRAVHEEGYRVEREADGALRFRRPDGMLLPDVPPVAEVPADSVAVLRAEHDGDGPCLHTRLASGTWSGERFSVADAIDVLHPRAADRWMRRPSP
jgi:5-methylcytosine-specific restriction endonuclease McrA